jgi:hypothetical protein
MCLLALLSPSCSSESTGKPPWGPSAPPPSVDPQASSDAATFTDASSASGPTRPGGSDVTATSLAEQLLSAPNAALLQRAVAEHQPSAEELAIVVAYWAFLVSSSQAGTLEPVVLRSGIQDAVLALASKYPSFFARQVLPDGGLSFKAQAIVNSPADFSCRSGCVPGYDALSSAGLGVLSAISNLSQNAPVLATLLGVEAQFLKNLQAGLALSDAALQALSGTSLGNALATAIAIGNALASAAGTFAATAAEAAAIASVGAVFSALGAGYGVGTAINLVLECEQWQSAHACGSGCCDTSFICADPTHSVCCPASGGVPCGSVCCATGCADPARELCAVAPSASIDAVCGDGVCGGNETATTCPRDCPCPADWKSCGAQSCVNPSLCCEAVDGTQVINPSRQYCASCIDGLRVLERDVGPLDITGSYTGTWMCGGRSGPIAMTVGDTYGGKIVVDGWPVYSACRIGDRVTGWWAYSEPGHSFEMEFTKTSASGRIVTLSPQDPACRPQLLVYTKN